MKNILLGISVTLALIIILEAAGAIEWIDSDTYVLSGFCDNSGRNLNEGVEGGGTGIDEIEAEKLLIEARRIMEEKAINLHHEYFLSKAALDKLFSDRRATGIFIAPYFEEDFVINLMVGKSICDRTLIDTTQKFAFIIKTFCPSDCEME